MVLMQMFCFYIVLKAKHYEICEIFKSTAFLSQLHFECSFQKTKNSRIIILYYYFYIFIFYIFYIIFIFYNIFTGQTGLIRLFSVSHNQLLD